MIYVSGLGGGSPTRIVPIVLESLCETRDLTHPKNSVSRKKIILQVLVVCIKDSSVLRPALNSVMGPTRRCNTLLCGECDV